jgi:hypothetical protein
MKKKISELDLKMFKNLTKLSQNGLKSLMYEFLCKNYSPNKITHTKEFIYAQGDIPIALVAHMDTVFTQPPKEIYFDEEQYVMWSPEGLGADDRAGVYLIMKIVQSGLKPSIILTTDEEKGCLGAYAFTKYFPKPPCTTNYLIQLDRRGSYDCVFYDCDNEDFVKYVENFGFVNEWGTFSDISEICPEWKIAGVNLSVGYIDEHTKQERLFVNSMFSTYEKIVKMLTEKEIPAFEYIPLTDYYTKYYESFYDTNAKIIDYEYGKTKMRCDKCKDIFSEYEVFPVKDKNRKTIFYCPDCICKNVLWCKFCQEAYTPDSSESLDYCGDCMQKFKEEGNNSCTKNLKKILPKSLDTLKTTEKQ